MNISNKMSKSVTTSLKKNDVYDNNEVSESIEYNEDIEDEGYGSNKKQKKTKCELEVLQNEKTEISCIYHISDVHIRNNERKDEYINVIDNVCEVLKKSKCIKNALVVVTGDLLDSRNTISGTGLTVSKYLFETISEIMPIIVIPGNHDCNMKNIEDEEILSPLLKDSYENIHYITNTGAYQYNNIIFGVTDVRTNEILTCKEIDVKSIEKYMNKYVIGLYHGTIRSSKLNNGYKMNDKKNPSMESFAGYDCVMLGDIHKHQYLGNEKRIAYAGSLIQQNYGESLDKHGILKWDLKTMKSELIEIHNDYGYITLNVNNNKLMENLKKIKVPKLSRFKIKITNTEKEIIDKIVNEITEKYNPIEILRIPQNGINNKNEIVVNKNEQSSILQLDQQLKYIKEYLQNEMEDDQIKGILKLHEEIYNNVLKEDIHFTSGQSWKLHKILFSNMFCYDENNIVDLTMYDENTIKGIIASNYMGKSSIVDIILYCLFDKFSRGDKPRDVMNNQKNNMSCTLTFSVGIKKYIIEKSGIRSGTRVNSETRLYELNDNNKIELARDNKSDTNEDVIKVNKTKGNKSSTNAIICQLIGEYDDFVSTCICTQINSGIFIDKAPTEKNKILCEMLKLDVFDKYRKCARNKLNDISAEINKCKTSGTMALDKISINELNLSIKKIKSEIDISNNTLNKMNGKIINQPILNLPYELSDIKLQHEDDFNYEIGELEKYIDDNKNINYDNNQKMLKKYELELINLKEKYSIKTLDDNLDKYNDGSKKLREKIIPELPEIVPESILLDQRIKCKKYVDKIEDQKNILGIEGEFCIIDVINELKYQKKLLEKDIDDIGVITIEQLHKKITQCKNKKSSIEKQLNILINKNSTLTDNEIISLKQEKKCNIGFINKCVKINSVLRCIELPKGTTCDELQDAINDHTLLIKTYKQRNKDIIIILSKKNNIDEQNLLKQNIETLENNIENYLKKINIKESNDTINNKINDVDNKLIICESYKKNYNKLNTLKKYIDDSVKNNKLVSENNNIYEKIQVLEEKINKIKKIKTKFNILEKNIYKYSIGLSDIKKSQDTLNKLKLFLPIFLDWEEQNNKYLKNREEKQDIQNSIKNNKEKLLELEMRKKLYDEYCIKTNKLQSDKAICEQYDEMLKQKNLQSSILQNYIPILEYYINNMLKCCANFSIKIKNTKEKLYKNKMPLSGVIMIYIVRDNKLTHIALTSGYERFIVNLGFRIALREILHLGKPNFCIIDEGWVCSDKSNLTHIPKVLEFLKSQYEHVILISHLHELQHMIDKSIVIKRNTKNNTSHVDNTK